MATKINKLHQLVPRNALLFSSWMESQGISRTEQVSFVKSEWLDRIATGVYYFVSETPTLFSVISSYNTQLGKQCVVGASTALDVRGFSHYGIMGKPLAYICTTKKERLPKWLLIREWDMEIRYFTTNIFGSNTLGVESFDVEGIHLLVSSPERAFMECLQLSPTYYSLMDLFYVMEMLTTLRPKFVQQLLENCSSVKVKRLFLYMAEKAKHQWFKTLDLSKIDLGKGVRSLVANGVTHKKYQITIPKELYDYE